MAVNGNRNHWRSFCGFDIHLMGLECLYLLTYSIFRAQGDDAPLGDISWLAVQLHICDRSH